MAGPPSNSSEGGYDSGPSNTIPTTNGQHDASQQTPPRSQPPGAISFGQASASQPVLRQAQASTDSPLQTQFQSAPMPGQAPSPSSASAQQQQQPRSVKRPRPVKSCTECRKRKLRCDRLCPCSQCQKSRRACKYAVDHDSTNLSDGSDAEMGDVSRPSKRHCLPNGSGTANSDSGLPNTKSGELSGANLVEELLSRMERMEKQLAGRSPAATDFSSGRLITAPTNTIRGLSVKTGALRTRFHGQNSSRVLMNLVRLINWLE